MDDPMRGVDIGTKLEVYDLIREEAASGRTFLWYTTETEELDNCDHVYVFRNGRIVADLAPRRADRGEGHPVLVRRRRPDDERRPPAARPGRRARLPLARACCARLLPALSLALVLIAIAWLNPRAISYFGFNLMLNLAIPIALATIAQMFVITGNDLDLSIGTFVGFVGCVTATWLHDAPLLGVAGADRLRSRVYAALGALIHLRNLPSIVVTLGMSFVWQGLAILLLPKPGGKAPDWLLGDHGPASRPSSPSRSSPRS